MRSEETPEKLLARGRAFMSIGDYGRAEQYFAAALDHRAEPRVALPLLLRACAEEKRYRAALDYAEPQLRRHPDDVKLRFVVASFYSTIGDVAAARTQLERVVKDKPEHAAAQFALAVLLRDEQGDPVQADLHFREYLGSIRRAPTRDEARGSLLKLVPRGGVPITTPPPPPPGLWHNVTPPGRHGAEAPGEGAVIPREVFAETLLHFFAPIRPFLDDPAVSDIMINGPSQIFVEKQGLLHLTDARFESREALMAALRNAAQFVGKHIDEDHPILEGRLPDGSRLEAILPPAAPDGPAISIRRFFKETLTVERLVGYDALTPDAAVALHAFVAAKMNIVIAGGTGSGKTSMLNALSSFIPGGERVVVIEDSRELQLQRQHVVQLEARPGDPKGRGAVSIRDLFKATLRLRPDRIVVGEIRGGEALDLVQAMTSGHGGCLTTVHATYPRDTLTRLETMCMMSDVEMPLVAMRLQLASGVNILVQVTRQQDGQRKLTHITEVLGFDVQSGTYLLQDLFVRTYGSVLPDGTLESALLPTGILPNCLPQLREHGVDLPAAVYAAAEQRRLAAAGAL